MLADFADLHEKRVLEAKQACLAKLEGLAAGRTAQEFNMQNLRNLVNVESRPAALAWVRPPAPLSIR